MCRLRGQSRRSCGVSPGADHMTLDVLSEDSALEATEESMKTYGIQQDVENRAQETEARHRKESVDRRLHDLHHTISDNIETFSHHQVTTEKHKDKSHRKVPTDDLKPRKPEGIDEIACSVTREVLHEAVNTVINEEVSKMNQEALVYEESTRIKIEQESSILRLEDLLTDLEPEKPQKHQVPPTSSRVLKSNLNLAIQDVSEEASICYVTVTSENIDQESPGDLLDPPVIMEFDDLDVPEMKNQHKKLVTPASEADRSPCDQGEEARKTWEHLQETAVRLAMQCDLVQDDDHECKTFGSGENAKTSHIDEIHLSRPDEQGHRGECLENKSHDPKEIKELHPEENKLSDEVSGPSEDNRYDEQDQKVEKMRKRVRFSPSTEERDQMCGLTSELIGYVKVDVVQEGVLEPATECSDHLLNLYTRPEPKDEEDDVGFLSGNQDIEPSITDSTTEENQVNQLHARCTVWYDEPLEMTAEEKMCEYIGDMISQSIALGFEETIMAISDKKSLEELSSDAPSIEKMQDSKEESTGNSVSILGDIIVPSRMDFDEEYHHGEGTWPFEFYSSLEKSPGVVSYGSNFVEQERTVSLEVLSQSSEAMKVDLVLNKDTEFLKQKVLGEDDGDDTDGKEELLGLVHYPSNEETKESTEGGLKSMTNEGLSVTQATEYTPDERYNQTSVQEPDTSITELLQGDSHDQSTEIIDIESERYLSSNTSNTDIVQTTEELAAEVHNNGAVGSDLPMTIETQVEEEDLAGKEYEDIEDSTEAKHKNLQKHVSVKEEHHIQEIEDYTWYRQDSYPRDGFITYSNSNEKPGSQEDQKELSKQLPYKDSESEVMFEDLEDLEAKDSHQVRGSEEDLSKVSHPCIVSETKPRNTRLSPDPEGASGSDNESEGICSHSNTGSDVLTEIQSVINSSLSEQDVSGVTGRLEVTHGAVPSGNMEMEYIEDNFEDELNFQADNVVRDFDLQSTLIPDHLVDKILGDLAEDGPTSVTINKASEHQSLDSGKELEIPLDTGSFAEDHIDAMLEQSFEVNNISELQGKGDLLSELHSWVSMNRPAEVTEAEKEIYLNFNATFEETLENKEEDRRAEDQSSITVDESLSEHLGDKSLNSVKELEIPLDPGSPPEDNTEEIKAATSDLYSGTHEGAGDLLPNMDSSAKVTKIVSNLDVSDKREEDEGHFSDEDIVDNLSETVIVEQLEHPKEDGPSVRLSVEPRSIIEPEHTYEEHHNSSIGIMDTQVEAADFKKIIIDPTRENHCDLDTKEEKSSESKEGEESQSSDTLDDASRRQFGDLKINEIGISLETGSLIEDIDIHFLSSVTVDESLSEDLGDTSLNSFREVEIPLDLGSSPEGKIEEIKATTLDLYSGTHEGAGDLLPNMDSSTEVIEIVSTLNLDVSDKRDKDGDHFSDEAIVGNKTVSVKQQEHPEENGPSVRLSEKPGSIIKPEHTYEEHHYSSLGIMDNQVKVSDFNKDFKKTEIHPSPETQCDLDTTGEKTSQSKEEDDDKSQTSDDASRKQFGNLKGSELETPLETGSLFEDINVSLLSTSELFQGDGDLLSEIHSVMTTGHPTDNINLVSSGEEHILDASKASEVLDESAVDIQVDVLQDAVILDEQEQIMDNFTVITYSEEFGSSLMPSKELEKNLFSSSCPVSIEDSPVVLDIAKTSEKNLNVRLQDQEVLSVITREYTVEVTTITSTVELTASDGAAREDIVPKAMTTSENEGSEETTQELCPSQPSENQEKKVHEQESFTAMLAAGPQVIDITGWDINNFPKTTDHFGSSDMEIRYPPSMDHTKQEVMEEQAQEQNKHVITIHTEEPSTSPDQPTHMELSEDQGKPLENHKATLKEPSVEEDDDVDNNLLPHNTLDVSAQKSRVQLRRKTSIRRKQGQRQVTPESEPMEPPEPVPRPRPMGMPIFPGKIPIFAMAPAMMSEAPHPEEEQKKEKPAEEELLVKPKKGIPRHAGFGIPHPQMMQELQARMKKKKPNE
ncbi:uncharacterized protein LOC130283793 isoform X2 [Hyla sarda]|uniref:uncharacterized protein LOC130283793 isoform X2 n=1 Tax=Hyla sarda TaxID=327740 RepID=UPI0024C23E32|nr:uncharacterized protein LOC130283793 isoform X2 [Hyla sarda]